jgi:pimeloyl-ACP methyl ester carboxylesterase
MTPGLSILPSYDTLVAMSARDLTTVPRMIELPDQEVHVLDRDPLDRSAEGSRTPLLFLHGGAVDSRMWEPQLAAFPEHRVLAADARGHGRSSDASAPYRLADDAVALLDAL